MTQTTDAVTQSVLVPLAPGAAFELFTDRFSEWWPTDSHHILEDAEGVEALLEARAGGRWFERAGDGRECDWGRVLELDRPSRILLAWQLTPQWKFDPDMENATQVEVTFEPDGDGTRVTLEHRGFDVHGEAGAAMRESVSAEGGWAQLMELYRNAA
jgi:uncharacterized protein YndB with AHSA1/START domain